MVNNNKQQKLNEISMVCANYGNHENLRNVLLDWFEFLGGKPGEVIIFDAGGCKKTRDTCISMLDGGLIDTLCLNKEKHPERGKEFAYLREYHVANLARKKYLLFFKFDTLPFKNGHSGWLNEAIESLENKNVFAFGGSSNYKAKHHNAQNGFYFSNRLSENFALIKRHTHTQAMREYASDFIDSGFRKHNPDKTQRRTVEVAWENYIKSHQVYTLMKIENEDWTVFHTNITGEKLKEQRKKYKKRIGVQKYINAGLRAERDDKWFYGQKVTIKSIIKRTLRRFGLYK